MSYNPQIVAGIRTADIKPAATVLADVAKQDADRAKAARDARAQQEQDALDGEMRQAFQEHKRADGTPDYDAIANRIMSKYPTAGIKLQQELYGLREKAAQVRSTEFKARGDRAEAIAQRLNGVKTQQQLDMVLPEIAKDDPSVAERLKVYDPDRIRLEVNAARAMAEQDKQQQDALTLALGGKFEEYTGRVGPLTKSQAEWDDFLDGLRHFGAPEPLIKNLGPTWSEAAVKKASELGYTASQRDVRTDRIADNDRLKATADQAAADKQADNKRADKAAQDLAAYRNAQLGLSRQRLAQSAANGGGGGAKDDPTIPNGVKQYIGQLRAKYKTYGEAEAELKRAMPDLYRDHPKLSNTKVFSLLDGYFGKRSSTATPFEAADEEAALEDGADESVALAPSGSQTSSVPTPAKPAAAAPKKKVGEVVNTKRGRLKITKIYPDGSYDGVPE